MVIARHLRAFNAACYLMVFVTLFDQLSKAWVVEHLEPGDVGIVTFFFKIVYGTNRGITFGILNRYNPDYVVYGLIAIAAIVVGFLFRWLWRTASRLVAIALGLIIGGAIGNVVDRVRYGYVVDFLDFHLGTWHYPAFNLADSAIVTGVGLLLLDSLVRGPEVR